MHISSLKEGKTVYATMENRADEATGQLSRLHTSRKTFYTLSVFIILIFSSLSLPFRFQSFGKFTSFLDANRRHYIFLLCSVILFFLFLDSSSNQAEPKAKKIEYFEISATVVGDRNNCLCTHDQIEDVQTELVVYVNNEHELVTDQVRQIEQNGVLVSVDDGTEDSKTELALDFEDKHELIANSEVEEHEQEHEDVDQLEANEFEQKCAAFIRKVSGIGMLNPLLWLRD